MVLRFWLESAPPCGRRLTLLAPRQFAWLRASIPKLPPSTLLTKAILLSAVFTQPRERSSRLDRQWKKDEVLLFLEEEQKNPH